MKHQCPPCNHGRNHGRSCPARQPWDDDQWGGDQYGDLDIEFAIIGFVVFLLCVALSAFVLA